jgi:hypothetical protein
MASVPLLKRRMSQHSICARLHSSSTEVYAVIANQGKDTGIAGEWQLLRTNNVLDQKEYKKI